MKTRLAEAQRHIEEGLKIPNNEPIQRQLFIGNRNIDVTFYFGTKTQEEMNNDLYEVMKREFLLKHGYTTAQRNEIK
jgi:hypothetical protein